MDKRFYDLFLDSLIGNQVKTEEGECLGKIEELVIDPHTGHVKSVVLSLGDAPRFGSALSSIPWDALKMPEPEDSNGADAEGTGNGTRDKSQTGNPKSSNPCMVYTYPVRRSR